MTLRYIISTIALAVVSLCLRFEIVNAEAVRDSARAHSRVERLGLRVDFSTQCSDQTVQLYGVIMNLTSDEITIQSGSFPWQYDVLGSEFVAEAAGSKLKRDWTTPILGRVGPITLEPHEHRAGTVPISTLFPDFSKALAKGPVEVHWKYWTGAGVARADPHLFEGTLVIQRSPCR